MAYYVIGGRQSGKTIILARKAVKISIETGAPVAVTSELTKQRILEEASRQGVAIPEPIVLKLETKPAKIYTFAGVIVDYEF